jgi:hypothetical protein
MAIAKPLKSPFGTDAGYHMIAAQHINSRDMSATVLVASYLSAETRGAEKAAILALKDAANAGDETALAIARGRLAQNQPMMTEEVGIPTEVYITLVDADDGDLRRGAVYDWLKAAKPKYAGATDA